MARDGNAVPVEPEPQATDFFEPGHTYTRNLPYRAPELRPDFQCVGVGQHPTKDEPRAFGFYRNGSTSPWGSSALNDKAWADGWVDVTGDVPTLTVFRASHDSIVMGLYTTAAEARKHCEAEERRSWSKGSQPTSFDWIEDDEDGVAELTVWIGGEECETGYMVTPLTIASEYDPEADE